MRYQICLSGAAKGKSVEEGKDLAFAMGEALAQDKHTLLTGATTGLPYYAAKGAKQAGGQSIGLSPAASRIAHVRKYRLPLDAYDAVLFTGLRYVGRDNLLVGCAEAVIIVGGRIGTTHEFTVALESDKPVAILKGAGGTSDMFKDLLKTAGKDPGQLIIETDPHVLLRHLEKALNRKYQHLHSQNDQTSLG